MDDETEFSLDLFNPLEGHDAVFGLSPDFAPDPELANLLELAAERARNISRNVMLREDLTPEQKISVADKAILDIQRSLFRWRR
jgi:hypothetical protein